MKKERLYLIDATALLYRAYFAFIRNPLVNSQGMNTNAIFGVVSSFFGFVQKFEPQHIIVSFDRKAPTFRHEMSEQYKANRPPMPDELILQVEPVKQFFADIGLKEISKDGLEADDILATLAHRFKDKYEIVIVTGDKDYSQLVQDGVTLYDPMKDKMIDREQVLAKYGITPEQFVDYLAIVGDSSDNIPGVKGLGPKGAETLLTEYKTLDAIYANLDKLPAKVKEKLIASKDNAYLSRELAQMILDAPIPNPTVDDTHFSKEDLAKATSLLDEYEMPTLKKRLLNILPQKSEVSEAKSAQPTPDEPIEEDISQTDLFSEGFNETGEQASAQINTDRPKQFKADLVNSQTALDDLIKEISKAEQVSLDTETTSTDPLLAELVGISICTTLERAYYLPLAHSMAENLDTEKTLRQLKQALTGKTIIGHNLKYDLMVLKRYNLEFDNSLFDTMLAAYILDPGINQYSLDQCALRELNYVMQPISELIGTGKNQITFDLVEVEKACFYSAEDAWCAFRLYHQYIKKLEYTGLDKLYFELELPLLPVLQFMEETGVHIDTKVLGTISHMINEQLKILTEKIYAKAGYQFNLNSTQQLAKLLFEELKLPAKKKTKTGFSTDNSVLEELSDEYEIAALLIDYRQLTKLESTYVSALPKMINTVTNRVHSSFNQTITSTGRLSSSNPNLQNIPIRTQLGREIRKAFSAEDNDTMILSADYSQIELRLLALMSEDPYLLDAFARGVDIHRQTAAYIYNKQLEEVTNEQRRQAKVINFGLLYGMGQVKLSRELGISQPEAKEIIKHYFEQFESVKQFILHTHNQARQKHYSETLFGRRLYLPYINSSNQKLKSEAERVALNMPIQGTAADLIKLAMIDIHKQIIGDKDIKMVLQVHDELVFEVKTQAIEKAMQIIKTAMSDALPEEYRQKIKLEVEAGYGKSWFEAHA
ncbi:MAG: DNA polymerase I [Candidatus Cloacimonadaceae bacterium]